MDGKPQLQGSNNDFTDPFNAGQMMGMLVMLNYIEKNKGITQQAIEELQKATSNNLQEYLKMPSEDIHLMVDRLVIEVPKL